MTGRLLHALRDRPHPARRARPTPATRQHGGARWRSAPMTAPKASARIHRRLSREASPAEAFALRVRRAEALEVAADVDAPQEPEALPGSFGSQHRFERVEAGALYLTAGYDANAAV